MISYKLWTTPIDQAFFLIDKFQYDLIEIISKKNYSSFLTGSNSSDLWILSFEAGCIACLLIFASCLLSRLLERFIFFDSVRERRGVRRGEENMVHPTKTRNSVRAKRICWPSTSLADVSINGWQKLVDTLYLEPFTKYADWPNNNWADLCLFSV